MATNVLQHRQESQIGSTTFQNTFILAERESGRTDQFFRGGALMQRSTRKHEVMHAIHTLKEQMREVVLRPAAPKRFDDDQHEDSNDQKLRAITEKEHHVANLRGNRST